jgi:lysophospholipase L1-like esterase
MSRTVFAIAALVCTAVAGASTSAARADEPPAACQPEKWAEAIAEFEQEDAREAPPKEGIVFVGSSSIRLWDLGKWFPGLSAINRGFGGSQMCDSAHFAEQLVVKHRPRLVVVYAGDNDINGKKTPQQVHDDFRAFVAAVRKPLPETRIIYIAIKPSTLRWSLAKQMQEANKLIAADCRPEEGLEFLDVWPAMLGDDGRPRPELFREDGLHLNDEGYELWTKLLRPHLEERK